MNKQLILQAEKDCQPIFKTIQKTVEKNQHVVLNAFREEQIGDFHFSSSDGYGYGDSGRDGIEALYANVFGGEDALVRPQIVSGTHAISTALYSLLRPGDELIYMTGRPYDTLEEIIGLRGNHPGSMKDHGILYNEVDLLADGSVNFPALEKIITERTKVIGIQRSKGYTDRPSFTIADIKEMIDFVKDINDEIIIFVDNCYGEFVETMEPTHVGADIIAGSLIKNPGGGLVRAGGYIVGREDLIEQAANRLTAPGLGKETGATFNMLQEMYHGFFMAPHIVGEALKGAVFTARLLELLEFKTSPHYLEKRTDIIQSVTFGNREQMLSFCQAIQQYSPINSYVQPQPSEMPGYDDQVIMAGGTFIQGSSIELSADGPLKEPYITFIQGGLTYEHVKIAITGAIEQLMS